MLLGCDQLKFKEIYVEINYEASEALYPLLEEQGIEGWHCLDKGSRMGCLFYLPANRQWEKKWETIRQKLYQLSNSGLEPGPIVFDVQEINSRSWEKIIEEAREPRQVLAGLWVVPPDFKDVERLEGLTIKLKGGMAFGTGDHPSTRLALGLVRDWMQGCSPVLDLGTGSGILALAAAGMGAQKVVGIDNDPEAVLLARENVRLNNREKEIEIVTGNLLQGVKGPFSGVIINILLPEILEVLPHLERITRPGSGLVISGLLFRQFPVFRDRVQNTPWEIIDTRVEGDWAGLFLQRKG